MEKRPDEEGMGPLERGRRRYQKKDFAGALEAFTEVPTAFLSLKFIHCAFALLLIVDSLNIFNKGAGSWIVSFLQESIGRHFLHFTVSQMAI
jgi:hypothetical protein